MALVLALLALPAPCLGQTPTVPSPQIQISLDQAGEPRQIALVLEIFLLLTVLSLAPALFIMVTSFTRIVVVLSLLRQALGTQQMPPRQVVIGLALFLTFFIMQPVFEKMNDKAIQPYLRKEMDLKAAFQEGLLPLREFMARNTREKDIALFVDVARLDRPSTMADVPTTILVPAFMISELNAAFEISFLIYIPFLIVDMVVASVLLSMGMMMLPPIMVSLPFKLMLFVLVDGWYLVVGSLVKSYVQ